MSMSMKWEKVEIEGDSMFHDPFETMTRARVPGGWLVKVELETERSSVVNVIFYPDPNHEWAQD